MQKYIYKKYATVSSARGNGAARTPGFGSVLRDPYRSLRPLLLCSVLLTVALSLFCSSPAAAAPATKAASLRSSGITDINFTDTGQYGYAALLLKTGDYRGAAREFSRLIENFPLSKLVGSAQLGMARAHFYSGRYAEAKRGAALYLKNYPDSAEARSAIELLKSAGQLAHGVGGARPIAVSAEHATAKAQKRHTGRLEGRRAATSATAPATAGAAMKAVQIPLFLLSSYADISTEFDRLKSTGLDTVIVRVFHNRGDRYYAVVNPKDGVWHKAGLYFATDNGPVIDDVLTPLVELAHGSGLKIFAWMTTRYADYGLEKRTDLACTAYDPGLRKKVRCKGLDLFNPAAVKHLEALYSDLAEYDIDGILFQDDLVLRQTEGFGERAETLFEAEFGIRPTPENLYVSTVSKAGMDYTPLFWRWAQWKNRRLLDVAQRLKSTVTEKNPGVRFAINLMYESVTNPPYALAWLSQDLTEAVATGFDYYSIMAYHRQMESELNRRPVAVRGIISKMVRDAARTVQDPSKVLIKLQIVDWESGESIDKAEVMGVLKEVSGAGNVSLAVVPYRGDFPYAALSAGKGMASIH